MQHFLPRGVPCIEWDALSQLANNPDQGEPRRRLSQADAWRNSYWFAASVAVFIGALVVFGSRLLDLLVNGIGRGVLASDWLAGALVTVLCGAALVRIQMRRRELLRRTQIIEDVNHHVRNALAAITLTTALREDKELNALVKDASERIDWVLSEVLPSDAAPSVPQPPRWRPGRQLGLLGKKEPRPR